jgi:hypothetical protein
MKPSFLDRFDRVTRGSGDGYRADCTMCGSSRALSFLPGDDRWILAGRRAGSGDVPTAHCGCRTRDVLAAVDLTFEDLRHDAEWIPTGNGQFRPRPTSALRTTTDPTPNGDGNGSRGGNTPAGQTSAPAPVQVEDGSEPLTCELRRLWRERKIEAVPVRCGELPGHATPAMRHVARDLELLFGLLLAEGVTRALIYATSEPVEAGIVTTRGGASYVLGRLEDEGVIVCIGEARKLGRPNGPKLFVPPGWRPADPAAFRRAQERRDGAALEKLVWIPGEASDGVPVPVGEPGAVPVEAKDVQARVPVDPLAEAPDEAGVRNAVPGGGGLRGPRASVGGAGDDVAAVAHGSDSHSASGRTERWADR